VTIELRPDDEKLIQKRLQSGAFGSVEDVIHDALAAQDAETEWLTANKDAINESIARSIAQLDRGEGVSGEVPKPKFSGAKPIG